MCAETFDPAKAEFQNWFNNREVVSSSGQHLRITDCTFGRYVDVFREIPDIKSFLLCSSRIPVGERNVMFTELSGMRRQYL
jgi:hypothetical protein